MPSVLKNPGVMLKAKEPGPSIVVHKGIGDFKVFKDLTEYAIHHLEEFQKDGKITYKRFQLLRKSIKLGAGSRPPVLQKKLESYAKMACTNMARNESPAHDLHTIAVHLENNKEHALADQFIHLRKNIR